MAEITECTAADRDEFWQDTPQDVTGATETSEDQERAGGQVMDEQITERAVEAAAEPPVPKYELTLTITGNSFDEITEEIERQTRGGMLLDSDYERRDEWHVIGGRSESVMRHTNPDMTPDRYDRELSEWFNSRKALRGES